MILSDKNVKHITTIIVLGVCLTLIMRLWLKVVYFIKHLTHYPWLYCLYFEITPLLGLFLLDFLYRTEDLQSDMDITLSMDSDNISKLGPHKAYRFDVISAVVLKRYALLWALCPEELIYCVHLSDFNALSFLV